MFRKPLPSIIYAIGDVHGEADRLRQMHDHILDRHAHLHPKHPLKLIHLGDYVDRGPDSAGVIEQIMRVEKISSVSCINLRGNHEAMMLDGLSQVFPTAKEHWLKHGGKETLQSYYDRGHSTVPDAHLKWLSACPLIHIEKERKLIFVHAGIRPDEFPNDSPEIYLWTRSPAFFEMERWNNPDLVGWTVVHGHTPTDDFYPDEAEATSRRINIDTGAVFGGRLTAAAFVPGETVRFLYT